jgi:hypothetical protein
MLDLASKPAKGKSSIVPDDVIITPEIAEAWLTQNNNNRPISAATIRKYARDMRADKWLFTGDAIRFDKNRVLIDGQHRLMACIAAETPFRSLVVYGVEPDAKSVIDGALMRRPSDVLAMDGYHNVLTLASAARWLALAKLHSGGDGLIDGLARKDIWVPEEIIRSMKKD